MLAPCVICVVCLLVCFVLCVTFYGTEIECDCDDFASRDALIALVGGGRVPRTLILMYLGLRACILMAYSLGQPILDLATHSLHGWEWRGPELTNIDVFGVGGL